MTDHSKISLMPYVDILYRYRIVSICAFVVGLVVTFVTLPLVPRTYSSSATLMFATANVPGSNGPPGENERFEARIQTLAIKVLSTERLAELVRRYDLYPKRSEKPGALEDITAYMRKRISIEPLVPEAAHQGRLGSRLFRVTYEYSNPATTQAVVWRLSQLLVDEDLKERERKANASIQFFERQVAALRVQLDSRSEAIKLFEQRHRGSLPQDLNANLNMLGNLHTDLDEARRSLAVTDTRKMDLERRIAETRSNRASSSSAGSSGVDNFASPAEAVATLETRLTLLRAQYSDRHPDVIRLREDIAALKGQASVSGQTGQSDEQNPLLLELNKQTQMLTVQIQDLKSHIKYVENEITECRDRIAATPSNGQQLVYLERENEVLANHYHEVSEQKLAAEASRNLDRSRGGEQLQVLESPKIPRHPTFPDKLSFVTTGVMASVCLALGLPFALLFTDTSYSDGEELQRQCGVRVLASIPDLNGYADAEESTIAWRWKNP